MKECWSQTPTARPPMLRAKKSLQSLKDTLAIKISSTKQVIVNINVAIENKSTIRKRRTHFFDSSI